MGTVNNVLFIFGCSLFWGIQLGDSADFKCPSDDLIQPCHCFINWLNLSKVVCSGEDVTQRVLNNLVTSLRQENSLDSPNMTLYITWLEIWQTGLERIDLSPFLESNLKLVSLILTKNVKLTSIVGPTEESSFEAVIDTDQLFITSSPKLNDQGLGEFLKYFSTSMSDLYLSNTAVTGGQYQVTDTKLGGDVENEFLPHLSKFTNLRRLGLEQNKIQHLEGGQFRRLTHLRQLLLDGNPFIVTGFGQHAFLFNKVPQRLSGSRIEINLQSSNLTREHFIGLEKTKLLSSGKVIKLFLDMNNIDHLAEADFRPFLKANPQNQVTMWQNPLVCDEKMSWLKKNGMLFKSQATYLACENDNGKDVFDSDLVP